MQPNHSLPILVNENQVTIQIFSHMCILQEYTTNNIAYKSIDAETNLQYLTILATTNMYMLHGINYTIKSRNSKLLNRISIWEKSDVKVVSVPHQQGNQYKQRQNQLPDQKGDEWRRYLWTLEFSKLSVLKQIVRACIKSWNLSEERSSMKMTSNALSLPASLDHS